MSYSVGRLAELLGISVRALHHYDEIGLLKPSERTRTGYRRYSEAEVERLRRILAYRELGFDLARIKLILDDSAIDPIEQLRRHKAELQAEVERLEQSLRRVETMLEPEKRSTGGRVGEAGGTVRHPAAQMAKGLAIAGGGFAGAVVSMALHNTFLRSWFPFDWMSVGAMVASALLLAQSSVKERSPLAFQAWNLLLWAGFWSGMQLNARGAALPFASVCLKFALVSAVLGMVIMSAPTGSSRRLFQRHVNTPEAESDPATRLGKKLWALVPAAYVLGFLVIVMGFANVRSIEVDVTGNRPLVLTREAIFAGSVEAFLTAVAGLLVVIAVSTYRSRRTQTYA